MGRLSFVAAAGLSLSAYALPHDPPAFEKRHEARIQHIQSAALEALGLTAFVERPQAFTNATHGIGHTVPLAAVRGDSPTSRLLASLLSATDPPGEASRATALEGGAVQPAKWSSVNIVGNTVYLTKLTIGGQDFDLVLDTGSADTWVVADPFHCRDRDWKDIDPARCRLAKRYVKSPTYRATEMQFETSYADGEKLHGEIGNESVTFAGLTVNATIGLFHNGNWNGDGSSSGLMGMAYPRITNAFDHRVRKTYNPIFHEMSAQGIVPPVFAIALGRKNLPGDGAMSFGGLPDQSVVQYSTDFASVPIETLLIGAKNAPENTMYIGQATHYEINGETLDVHHKFIVDSGTTMTYVPPHIMDKIANAWSPPLERQVPGGYFVTRCDSKVPDIKIKIGGKSLSINKEDLLISEQAVPGWCYVGIMTNANGFMGDKVWLMGGTMMKSLMVVFDVGAAEMRFSERLRGPEAEKVKAEAVMHGALQQVVPLAASPAKSKEGMDGKEHKMNAVDVLSGNVQRLEELDLS